MIPLLGKPELLQLIASRPEEEIRDILCRWLDCPSSDPTPTPAPTAHTPTSSPCIVPANPAAITVDGEVQNDGFYFRVPLASSTASDTILMHLDTGAFEMLLTSAVAQELNLPQGPALDVGGVTGNSPAYYSEVTVDLGQGIQHVQCVVDPSYTGVPLFGFRFLQDHQWSVLLDPTAQTVTFLPPVTAADTAADTVAVTESSETRSE